jgi:hypothetical protein
VIEDAAVAGVCEVICDWGLVKSIIWLWRWRRGKDYLLYRFPLHRGDRGRVLSLFLERFTALRVGVDIYAAASISSEWGNWKVVGRSLVKIQH